MLAYWCGGPTKEAPKRVRGPAWVGAGNQAYIDGRIFDSTTDQIPPQVIWRSDVVLGSNLELVKPGGVGGRKKL